MQLEQSFEVAAPLERVWEALIDVERVAPCLPGAEVTGRDADGSYDGSFKIKLGPASAAYSGKLRLEDIDADAHTATMQAQGRDRRGQGGAKATIVSRLTPGDTGSDTTRVEVVTDYQITGRLARFGRGGTIEDISNQLLDEFATRLETALAGDGSSGGLAAGDGEAGAAARAAAEAGAAEPAPVAEAPVAAAPVAEAAPVEERSPGLSLLWNQARRNPAAIAALIFGFLLALRVFRQRD